MGLREKLEDVAHEAQPSNEHEIVNYGVRCARMALEDVLAEIERDDPYMKLGAARIRQRLAQLG